MLLTYFVNFLHFMSVIFFYTNHIIGSSRVLDANFPFPVGKWRREIGNREVVKLSGNREIGNREIPSVQPYRIHLAILPHLSPGPATYLATEIGKILVSDGFLLLPGRELCHGISQCYSPGGYTFLESYTPTSPSLLLLLLHEYALEACTSENCYMHASLFSSAEVRLVGYTLPPFPPLSCAFLCADCPQERPCLPREVCFTPSCPPGVLS